MVDWLVGFPLPALVNLVLWYVMDMTAGKDDIIVPNTQSTSCISIEPYSRRVV